MIFKSIFKSNMRFLPQFIKKNTRRETLHTTQIQREMGKYSIGSLSTKLSRVVTSSQKSHG